MEPQAADSPEAKLPNKKVLIFTIAGFCVIILFIIITLFTSNSSKKDNTQVKPQQASKDLTQTNPQDLNNQNANTADRWNSYKNSLFSIDYPPDWKAQEEKLSNGAVEVKLYPLQNSDAINMIVLAEAVNSIPTIAQKQQPFIKLGFRSDSVIVDKLQANKLFGTLPPVSKTSTQSAHLKSLQMTHIYLDKGNYSYLFDYSYLGIGMNLEAENTINKIVNSFKFLQ